MDIRQRIRQRRDSEIGAQRVNPAADISIALAYPHTYRVGMASLGYQLVYSMFNSQPGTACERFFLPDVEDMRGFADFDLLSYESLSPVSRFDAVAFSLHFELDYLNVLRMLAASVIPVRRSDRTEVHPLVIAGGPSPTFNPMPMSEFVDVFVIGDAECVVEPLTVLMKQHAGGDREVLLGELARIPGLYVPGYSQSAGRALCENLDGFPSASTIRSPEAEFGDTTLLEVARGCARGCRFCAAGHIGRPMRPRTLPGHPEACRYGLVGAAIFDHPNALDLCSRIVDSGGSFSLSSVRLETISDTSAHVLRQAGQRTLTIAPEAGTDRLRRTIGKPCSEERILAAAMCASKHGMETIKLYFMVGLPTETDADVEAICHLAGLVAGQSPDRPLALLETKGGGRGVPDLRVSVSVSCFVPKPWTVFQWAAMEDERVLRRRLSIVDSGCVRMSRVSVSTESPRLAVVQSLISRGGPEVSEVLAAALLNGGDYRKAIRDTGINLSCSTGKRTSDEVLPWDHIDLGLDRGRLWDEYCAAVGVP